MLTRGNLWRFAHFIFVRTEVSPTRDTLPVNYRVGGIVELGDETYPHFSIECGFPRYPPLQAGAERLRQFGTCLSPNLGWSADAKRNRARNQTHFLEATHGDEFSTGTLC